ncbi:MAG: hypothetical protein QGI90_11370, partial [Nitrospinaceae bacterium]|nr:hypothetical protein [Nitrospinaceae bacterium]
NDGILDAISRGAVALGPALECLAVENGFVHLVLRNERTGGHEGNQQDQRELFHAATLPVCQADVNTVVSGHAENRTLRTGSV